MPLSKIKDQFKDKLVAFGRNRSDVGIGYRADVDQLAIIALESNNPNLIRLFDVLPDLATLKANKVDAKIKEIADKVPPIPVAATKTPKSKTAITPATDQGPVDQGPGK